MNLNTALVECFAALTALLLHEEHSETNFLTFQGLLEKNRALLRKDKLKLLFAQELNFCFSQYAKGNDAYLPRLFDLYKRQLEEGYLYENGVLPQHVFQNIVHVGLKMNDLNWVTQFLSQHRNGLDGLQWPQEEFDFSSKEQAWLEEKISDLRYPQPR